MKLLVFCYEYPPIGGGAGNALSYLCREWARAQHEVCVVTSYFEGTRQEEVLDGVRVVRVKVGRREISRGRVFEMARYMLASLIKAPCWYRSFHPDASLAFMAIPSGLGSLRLRLQFGLPYVVEIRGGDVPGFDPETMRLYHALTRGLFRWICGHSAKVIANGRTLLELAGRALPGMPLVMIPNGVDTSYFAPAERKVSGARPRVLYVGRFMESQKNISCLLKAFAEIRDAELMLVGDGPDRRRLVRLSASLGLGDRVLFRGWLKGKELLGAYQSADVYASAALWEGMPNTVLEAMACGLPLVLSRIGGHQDLLNGEENGRAFDPREPGDCAANLKHFLAHDALRKACGRSGRDLAVDRFSWRILAARHMDEISRAARR